MGRRITPFAALEGYVIHSLPHLDFAMDIEAHNERQIEQLNQRGGRTLSIVDLIRAGTVSPRMAAYAMRAVEQGASLLTGARPGGAGKTTLMAALVGFLPPGVPIVTVDRSRVITDGQARPSAEPACYLVHEIGSGHWYGYLWGRDVARFLSLADGNRRIASCLHADTLEELTEILCSPPLETPRESLGRVRLILFMHLGAAGRGYRRRVSAFWEADGQGEHRLRFQWRSEHDDFEQVGVLPDEDGLGRYEEFIQRLVESGQIETRAVRRRVIEFYRAGS